MEELLTLTRDNNRMLHSMHRKMIMGQVMSVIYWIIIIGASGWSYYLLQPYIEKYMATFQSAMKMMGDLQESTAKASANIPSLSPEVQKLLEKVR